MGIIDTSSDLNNCHRGIPDHIAAVKRGAHAHLAERVGLPEKMLEPAEARAALTMA